MMRFLDILMAIFLLLVDLLMGVVLVFGINNMIEAYQGFDYMLGIGIILYIMVAIFIVFVGCFAIQIIRDK